MCQYQICNHSFKQIPPLQLSQYSNKLTPPPPLLIPFYWPYLLPLCRQRPWPDGALVVIRKYCTALPLLVISAPGVDSSPRGGWVGGGGLLQT